MNVLDAMKDIIKHTHSLGFIDAVKVIGTPTDAKIETKDADNTIVIFGTMYQPIDGIESTIGLSRMSVLKGFIGMHETSTITVVKEPKNNVDIPVSILFDNKAEFTSSYRLMGESMINDQVKIPPFKGATWDIILTPAIASIKLLSESSGTIGTSEKRFSVSVDAKGTLKFNIGAGPSDKVVIPFATNVTGTLKHKWTYPLAQTLSILKLADSSSTATMSFSDMGALKIDIDSGIGKYSYILPAGRD